MGEDRLYRDAALARFYDLDNAWTEDRRFCLRFARDRGSVLDLGCGTGDLAIRIAVEHGADVTGADPARAMLDLARAKPGANRVRWIQADARTLDLGRRFDLVLMTGHAFQTLLTDTDRARALAAIARHLTPEGRFVFDSRNPAQREWEEWRPDLSRRAFDDPVHGPIDAWNDVVWDDARHILTYETIYRVTATGQEFRATSQIAFPALNTLERQIAAAHLGVGTWFGDWGGQALAADSPDFIAICRLADA